MYRCMAMYLAVNHLPLLGYFIMIIGDVFLLVLMLLLVSYVSTYTNTDMIILMASLSVEPKENLFTNLECRLLGR